MDVTQNFKNTWQGICIVSLISLGFESSSLLFVLDWLDRILKNEVPYKLNIAHFSKKEHQLFLSLNCLIFDDYVQILLLLRLLLLETEF